MEIEDRIGSVLQFISENKLKISPEKLADFLDVIDTYRKQELVANAPTDFKSFVKSVWPSYIEGPQHKIMTEAFQRIADGKLKRLIINMPPRHGKSQLASWLLPAWLLGRRPDLKILTATHTTELSQRFGRMVRNLVMSEEYKTIFPNISLRADSKAAGRWDVNGGGEYYAAGVGSALAGRGADIFIIDDPHSEEAAKNPTIEYFEDIFEWYRSGPRQRMQPNGAIVVVMTRWHQSDLTGKVMENAKREGVDKWEVIELPAIMPNGEPLWPGYWSLDKLLSLKNELPASMWMANYQQDPTSEGTALIKREWWKTWKKEKPPECEYIIQTWDTAHTINARSDYSACTTWGVFYIADETGKDRANIILLDAIAEKLEFPELKRRALDLYKQFNPDSVLIEAKSSGAPLAHELRAIGVPISTYTPSRGNDKMSRVNAVSDIFSSGIVWKPDTQWADEVMEQCAAFPRGSHDDLVDTTVMALMRFRQANFVRLPSDFEDLSDEVAQSYTSEDYY